MKKKLRSILSIVITILVPIGLVIGVIRIILNPWYPMLEYRTPWFPADEYGFGRAEREHYALITLQYLNTDKSISQLMDLRFPQGQTAPPFSCLEMTDCNLLFNDRELEHMIDVKFVLVNVLPAGYAIIGGLILLGWFAKRNHWWKDYLLALSRGGWLMILILISLIVLVVGFFDWFFTIFHNLFFASGTWLFYTSDTLIRLYPERFWMDTFLLVGLFAGIFGMTLILLGRDRPKNEI